MKGSPDKEMTVKGAAWAAFAAHNLPDGMEPNLEATATYDPPNFSWPGGAHAAVVEVDTETGDARLIRYVAVDDVGTVVNPLIVDGQVHGGITQGIATALYEEAIYDEDGNLSNGTLATYLVPSAAELPSYELDRTESKATDQPFGAKGVGETGHDRGGPRRDQRGDRRALASRRHRYPDAGNPGAGVARDRGGEAVIPAAFDYEVAESVEHALELLGGDPDAKAAGGRALARAGPEAPDRAAVEARRHRSALRPRLRARRRHAARDRRAHETRGRAPRPAPAGALPDRLHDGGQDRRPAGAAPRHDRRLARPRRPGLRPAGGDAGARRRARDRRAPAASGRCRAADFFTGVFQTAVGPGELLTEIRVPKLGDSTGWSYLKYHRRAQDWATVGVAALVHRDNGTPQRRRSR